jgi:hypothetical protein
MSYLCCLFRHAAHNDHAGVSESPKYRVWQVAAPTPVTKGEPFHPKTFAAIRYVRPLQRCVGKQSSPVVKASAEKGGGSENLRKSFSSRGAPPGSSPVRLEFRAPGCGTAGSRQGKNALLQVLMELAGLEPATSWVRSRRSLARNLAWLGSFSNLRAGSPNTFPKSLQPVLQYDNARPSSRATAARRRNPVL